MCVCINLAVKGTFVEEIGVLLTGSKIHVFEFDMNVLNFGTTCLNFGTKYLNFSAKILNFGATYLNFGSNISKSSLFDEEGKEGG